jgi:hypothetical protein
LGRQHRYGVLLALLGAGAHMEYLYDRGHLQVENPDQLEQDPSAPVCYRRLQISRDLHVAITGRIIAAVAIAQERSQVLSGILAAMPLSIPLAHVDRLLGDLRSGLDGALHMGHLAGPRRHAGLCADGRMAVIPSGSLRVEPGRQLWGLAGGVAVHAMARHVAVRPPASVGQKRRGGTRADRGAGQ